MLDNNTILGTISEYIDLISDKLEQKGFMKEAYELDIISNTLDYIGDTTKTKFFYFVNRNYRNTTIPFWYMYSGVSRFPKYRQIIDNSPEDAVQIMAKVWSEYGVKDSELMRRIRKEIWNLGKELGINKSLSTMFVNRDENPVYRDDPTKYPRCGVKNCEKRGLHKDPVFSRLCITHGSLVRKRKKLKFENPYIGLEKKDVVTTVDDKNPTKDTIEDSNNTNTSLV